MYLYVVRVWRQTKLCNIATPSLQRGHSKVSGGLVLIIEGGEQYERSDQYVGSEMNQQKGQEAGTS